MNNSLSEPSSTPHASAHHPAELISEYFLRLNANQEPVDLLDDVVQAIFDGDNGLQHREFHLASLLYSNPNPSVEFIVKLVRAALKVDGFPDKERVSLAPKKDRKVVSVAGSGKKGIKTINISTSAAIVAASLGAQVIKHASRATSSQTGSSDFFSDVGGRILDADGTIQVFNVTDFGLFSIEGMVPKFNALYGGRVLSPTALSYALPAAISPVRTDAILYGFSIPRIKESVLAIHEFGFKDVVVANSTDDGTKYIDEAGLFKTNFVAHSRIVGEDAGVILADPIHTLGMEKRHSINEILQKNTKKENVVAGVNILRGKGNEVQNEIVALNAGLMLLLSGACDDLRQNFHDALSEIQSARPYEKLVEIIEATGGEFNSDLISE